MICCFDKKQSHLYLDLLLPDSLLDLGRLQLVSQLGLSFLKEYFCEGFELETFLISSNVGCNNFKLDPNSPQCSLPCQSWLSAA